MWALLSGWILRFFAIALVAGGIGLVVGTADNVDVSNITFRNVSALDTTFGCHIKAKPPQHGTVREMLFENITVTQSANATDARVRVIAAEVHTWQPAEAHERRTEWRALKELLSDSAL